MSARGSEGGGARKWSDASFLSRAPGAAHGLSDRMSHTGSIASSSISRSSSTWSWTSAGESSEVDYFDLDEATALMYDAIIAGDPRALRAAFSEGASPRAVLPGSVSPLLLAIKEARSEIADMLLKMPRTDVHFRDAEGCDALLAAVRHRDKLKPLQTCIQSDRFDICAGKTGWTVLHYAAFLGRPAHVAYLVSRHGAGIGVDFSMDGVTALMVAATEGHLKVCEALVEAKANINIRGAGGATALCCAARESHISVIRVLLANGADVEATDDQGRTALHVAVEYSSEGAVRLLLSAGASVHKRARCGCSLLDVAARTGDVVVADLVLAAGAQPARGVECKEQHVDANVGHTTLTAAISAGNLDVGAEIALTRRTRMGIIPKNGVRKPHHWAL